MKKIAVIGKIHREGLDILKKNKCEIIELNNTDKKKLINNLKLIDGIALRTTRLDREIMKECKNLKIVSRHGVGYDNVDLSFLNKNNIALAITGTANAVTVSEHVMTMFLYLCKSINKSNEIVRSGKFKEQKIMPEFFELYKKNILILGFGRIGRELAKRCLGFESNVYVYDPFINSSDIIKCNCKSIDLNDGIKIADFISIHMPLNNETKNIISKDKFDIMKKNCILVNTARGGIVNENDLFFALKNKKIFGAGLDVYEKEPPNKSNPLFKLSNTIFSPHNAALTIECRRRMAVETCENIVNYLFNKKQLKLENIINSKNINLEV